MRIAHVSGGGPCDPLVGRFCAGLDVVEVNWTTSALPDDNAWAQAERLLNLAPDFDAIIVGGMSLDRLESIFRLRALQLAHGRSQIVHPVIAVLPQGAGDRRAVVQGFARRLLTGSPFRHVLFVAEGADAERLRQEALSAIEAETAADFGLRALLQESRKANISLPKSQPIAFQIQPIWGRCGSSTPFANQIDALIDSGAFVVRAFVDAVDTPSRQRHLSRIVAENRLDTAPHLESWAYPPADTPLAAETSIDAALLDAVRVRAAASLNDPITSRLARGASVAIVNHAINLGFALEAMPKAALVLETHDYLTRAAIERRRIGADDLTIPDRATLRRHLKLERALWRAADLCTTVSLDERPKIRRAAQDVVFALPRPYVRRAGDPAETAAWDILLVGDLHPFNLKAADAFLERATIESRLAQARIAVAGAMTQRLAEKWRGRTEQVEWLGMVADLDSVRDRARLSVCPDMAGAGVSIKTLTAIAAAHPMAATRFALRGLPPAITDLLPSAETLADLIDDAACLLDSADALARRRALARRAADALTAENGYAAALKQISQGRADRTTARRALRVILANSATLGPPVLVSSGEGLAVDLRIGGETHRMLGARWHGPEAHGRWTDGPSATIRLPTALLARGAWIEIACLTQSDPQQVHLALSGRSWRYTLAPGRRQHLAARIDPKDIAVDGPVSTLLIETDQRLCPIESGTGQDDRVLGLCVEQLTITPLPVSIPLLADNATRLSLVEDSALIVRGGWHHAEPFGRWTAASQAELVVTSKIPLGAPARVSLELAKPPAAPVRLKVNDIDAGIHASTDGEAARIDWRIDDFPPDTVLRLDIQYDAISEPRTLNPDDPRALGLAATTLAIDARPAPEAMRPAPKAAHSILFCKAFAPDLERFGHLARSILDHNQSDLPFFVSVPHADLAAFRHAAPAAATVIAEEEFVEARCFNWLDGWRQQQVVKLAFHQLGLCENYMVIDADCYFIRPFTARDLFGPPGEIRVVAQMGEKDQGYGALPPDYKIDLGRKRRRVYSVVDTQFAPGPLRIPELFLRDRTYQAYPPDLAWSLIPYAFSADRGGRRTDCLPPPMIFSAELLAAMQAMIAKEGLTFTDLIHLSPWEADWYGHFALKYFRERIRTVSPMFRHFTTDAQIAAARAAGVTRKTLARNYLGLNLAARHQSHIEL